MATTRSVAVGRVEPESTPDIDPWAETRAGLLAFVTRRVESPEAAEDIVQDVLERMQRADPATITHVSAWLYRAARNAIVDHYRSRRPTLSLDESPETGDHGDLGHESTEPAAVVQELAQCLRPLIEELPGVYRSAVTLVDLDGPHPCDRRPPGGDLHLGHEVAGPARSQTTGRAPARVLCHRDHAVRNDHQLRPAGRSLSVLNFRAPAG